MQTELQIIQTLREAETRASYDANQAFGQRVLSVEGSQAEIARVSTPEQYAQSWVVTLGPVTTPGQQTATGASGLNPQVLSDAAAMIEWGMGGSRSWAVVDWTAGQQFSVFGSFVRIIAQLNAWGPNGQPPGDAALTRFAGHIAPGRSITRPWRTIDYGDVIPINTPVDRPVPPFARLVRFSNQDSNGATVNANTVLSGWIRSGGDLLWQARMDGMGFSNVNSMSGSGIVFPAGTNFCRIRNAVNIIRTVRLSYELLLS